MLAPQCHWQTINDGQLWHVQRFMLPGEGILEPSLPAADLPLGLQADAEALGTRGMRLGVLAAPLSWASLWHTCEADISVRV